jgi:hypothetical protein
MRKGLPIVKTADGVERAATQRQNRNGDGRRSDLGTVVDAELSTVDLGTVVESRVGSEPGWRSESIRESADESERGTGR